MTKVIYKSRSFRFLLALLLCIAMLPFPEERVKAEGKQIKQGSSITMTVSQPVQRWNYSNSSVVKITPISSTKAKVTGIGVGTCVVSAVTASKTYSITIQVVGGGASGGAASSGRAGEQIKSQSIPGTGDSYFYIDGGKTVTGHFVNSLANGLISQTNSYRSSSGLGTLRTDPKLSIAAQIRAYEAAVQFSHTRPNGKAYYTVNESVVYGENLAYGYTTADQTMTAWKHSQAHNENLVRSRFKSIGIGVVAVKQSNGSYVNFVAQLFGV